MAKIKYIEYKHDGKVFKVQYLYNCPGCGYEHAFALKEQGGNHTYFNNDFERPTIKPSLVHNFTPGTMCHSFITDGKIQFLNDCTHELKGQTVDLPVII